MTVLSDDLAAHRNINVDELAEVLSVSVRRAKQIIAEDLIPSFKIGRLRRLRVIDVNAYVTRQLLAAGHELDLADTVRR